MPPEPERDESWILEPGVPSVPLVVTAEHAGAEVPPALDLGLPESILDSHWSRDEGIDELARAVADEVDAALVRGRLSRLVVDLNRAPDHPHVVRERVADRPIPGNAAIGETGRAERVRRWHAPYHEAVDRAIRSRSADRPGLVSLHSFTPWLAGDLRAFDIGILHDRYPGMARAARDAFEERGLRAELNRPYSGEEGFIYAVSRHGKARDLPYLEIEVNDLLLRHPDETARLARTVVEVLRGLPRFPATPRR